jgi:hypothetical protein
MKLEHENDILREHPLIYRELKSRLPTGERFECHAGWKLLLSDVSAALEQLARKQQREDETPLAIVQVKEKFGTLRVYFAYRKTDGADALVTAAYERSRRTCEFCGDAGEFRGRRGHMRVQCAQCDASLEGK